MYGIRLELSKSAALLGLPVLLFLHGFAAVRHLPHGVDLWDAASGAVVMSVLLAGPAAAGIAAWAAQRESRRQTAYLRLLSARSGIAAPAAEAVAALAWPVAAYLATALVVFGKTAWGATWGRPNLLWLLAGGLGLCVHVVLGYVLGRLVPRVWLPPLVAVATYLFAAWNLSQFGEGWYFLSPVTVQVVDGFQRLNDALFAGQALWYAGIAACLFLVWSLSTTRTGRGGRAALLGGLAVSVVVAAGGAGSVLAQHNRIFTGPHRLEHRCTGAEPQVCVHPAFAPGLPELHEAFTRLGARLRGTPGLPDRVEQRPRGWPAERAGTTTFAVDDLVPGFAQRAVVEYVEVLFAPCLALPGKDPDVRERRARSSVVYAWLTDQPDAFLPVSPAAEAAARWFADQGEAGRRQWLTRHYDATVGCDLSWADFR